jgi:hypothetical protein
VSPPLSTDSQPLLRADLACNRTMALRESSPQYVHTRRDLLRSAWLGVYPVRWSRQHAHCGDGI